MASIIMHEGTDNNGLKKKEYYFSCTFSVNFLSHQKKLANFFTENVNGFEKNVTFS